LEQSLLDSTNAKYQLISRSDKELKKNISLLLIVEGGVRVCGDVVLRYFWCGFAVIFILSRGIAVSKHYAVCGYYNL